MKAIISALAISVLISTSLPVLAAAPVGTMGGTTALVAERPAPRVPKGQTYHFYRNGQSVAMVRGGRTWGGIGGLNAAEVNCAKIPCPGTFKPDIVCWECH